MGYYDEDENIGERLLSPEIGVFDEEPENALRPHTIDEYVGQEQIKDNMKVFIHSAKKRGEALDHVLLYGPPGLGKTTLAKIIANELGVEFHVTSGPALSKPADLAAILSNLGKDSVLFVDEIHRMNHSVEEILYPAMEDFCLDMILGKGPSARTLRLPLNRFTLVGATTKAGMLSAPLRDRFGVLCRLELYSPDDLAKIVRRSSGILNIKITEDAELEIASRSRGTPRIANRLLRRLRDFAEFEDSDTLTLDIAKKGLERLQIDALGLDKTDINILKTIIYKFEGGPVGLDTLSASSGEEANTIEDVYEPYLMQLGFISRTPRGRICLKKAYDHIGAKYKPIENSLFDFMENNND